MLNRFGEMIKSRRESEGMSLDQLSGELEVSVAALWKIEHNKQRIDSEMMLKLASIFNTSLDELFNPTVRSAPIVTVAKSTGNAGNLAQELKYVIEHYGQSKQEPFANHKMSEHVRNKVTKTLYDELLLDKDYYLVTGSVGQGQWAEVPWICIFIRDITISATKGYYVVFLFKADGKGVYLSLNQGWTYFKEKYGTKVGGEKIQKTAELMRESLNISSDRFSTDPIHLAGRGPLAKGYERGHIMGTYYDLEDFPSSEVILEDVAYLLKVYDEVDNMRGNRTTEDFNDYLLLQDDGMFTENAEVEESFQENVQEQLTNFDPEKKEEIAEKRRKPVQSKSGKPEYVRRSWVSATALREANYQCVVNIKHKTFTSKKTGEQYVEAHHIIPMSQQEGYEYELDQLSNIAALCPTCHRLIHHGTDEERTEILTTLYNQRRDRLEKIGAGITLLQLKQMYGFKVE